MGPVRAGVPVVKTPLLALCFPGTDAVAPWRVASLVTGNMANMMDRPTRRVPQLDEDYATWSMLFKAYLVSRDLWDTIAESTAPDGREAEALVTFLRKDNKALAELTLGVKAQNLPTVGEAKTARDAWDLL